MWKWRQHFWLRNRSNITKPLVEYQRLCFLVGRYQCGEIKFSSKYLGSSEKVSIFAKNTKYAYYFYILWI